MNSMKKERDIFNTLKKQSLTKDERTSLLARIDEYRSFTPVRSETPAPEKRPRSFLSFRPAPVIASLLIFSFVGVGTAAAAEGAVPGDVLYPVKVGVTENVRAVVAQNDEARAEFEAWRAERRLDETHKLVARNALTNARKGTLEKRFEEHAARVETRIAAISETDPELAAELSTKFEASLAAHDALLESIDATSTESTRGIVRKNLDRIALVRAKTFSGGAVATRGSDTAEIAALSAPTSEAADEKAITETTLAPTALPQRDAIPGFNYSLAAERLFEATKDALRDVDELYEKVQPELSDEQQTRVEKALEEVRDAFDDAASAFAADNFESAYGQLTSILTTLKKLQIFLMSEVRGTISFPEPEPIRKPNPTPLPLPPIIDLPDDTETQIDPPSLELDAGPEDTDIPEEDKVDPEKRNRIKIRP